MSLWGRLHVGRQEVGTFEIQRLAPNGQPRQDDVCEYVVRIDDEEVGRVKHRYGDGAWALLRRALNVTTNPHQQ